MRWAPLYDNPNITAAVVTMLLCGIWRLRCSSIMNNLTWILLCVSEVVVCYLVVLTQSRSATGFHLLGAGLVSLVAMKRVLDSGKREYRLSLVTLLVPLCAYLIFGWYESFDERWKNVFVGDPSISNRWDVVEGSIYLFYSAPIHGWGVRYTGWPYMEFCQEYGSSLRYDLTTNGWLDLGIRCGGWALFLVGCVALFSLVCGLLVSFQAKTMAERAWGVLGASVSLHIGLLNCVNSCMFKPLLVYGWSFGLGTFVIYVLQSFDCRKCVRLFAGSAAIVLSLLIGLGFVFAGDRANVSLHKRSEFIEISAGELDRSNTKVAFVVDRSVLGEWPGRFVVSLVERLGLENAKLYYGWKMVDLSKDDFDVLVSVGCFAPTHERGLDKPAFIFVSPYIVAESKAAILNKISVSGVVLEQVDSLGQNAFWSKLGTPESNRFLEVPLLNEVSDNLTIIESVIRKSI